MRLCKQLSVLLLLIAVILVLLTSWKGYNMASGLPDWMRGMTLLGQDPEGNLVLIQVDADGLLTIPFKGEDPEGDLVTVAVDGNNQLYTIMKGRDDNILAIDSEGFMTAVLKGIYGEALKTLAVDSEGRIYGYQVDDLDQWGQTLLVGNAELAARLGSPVAWDRRGQVQLLHTFADGFMPMKTSVGDTDGSVVLDPTVFASGGYSAKLTGNNSGLNRYAMVWTMLGVPPSDRLGVAIKWSAVSAPQYLELFMQVYRDGDLTAAVIRYDFANKRLQYIDSEGDPQNLPVLDFYYSASVWCSMKMVIDHSKGEYSRALLNGTYYNMAGIAAPTSSPGTGDYVYTWVKLHSNDGDNDVAYIDTFIITSGEPENPEE